MGRKKVPLEYISHNKNRQDTLTKRSKGLMKKAGEVDILCDTNACVIVYPQGDSVPQMFSSHSDDEARALLDRFRRMEDHNPFNKKMDHECFLKKSIGKHQKQALTSARNEEEGKIKLLLHKAMSVGHAGLSTEEISIVNYNRKVVLKRISDRITKICGHPPVYVPSQAQEHAPAPNVTGDMDTTRAPVIYQAMAQSIPYVTGGMGNTGDSTMYKAQDPNLYFPGSMGIIGAPTVYQDQEPTPYVTGGMDTIGALIMSQAQEPPQQHDEWLELMKTGGGDLDTPVCTAFNSGATFSSNVGFNGNEMMQHFNLGAWFSFPQGGADPGPSSSAFPHM